MKRVLALLLVCALLSVSAAGHPFPVTKAAGEALYVEIPQDSYCRAPATTAYLPIMMGNLSDSGTMTIQSVEVLGTTGTPIVAESMEVALESMAGMVHSGEEIRTALGIAPATTTDITTAQTLIAETTSAADAEQQDTLVEAAFLASQAQQSMKNPDELTADEAQIQNLLKTETLAVDLAQFTTDVTSETAVPVTVRITGELAGQPFTIEQQTTVFLLASLPNGGMWHPGDGHVHTQGLSQPDTVYSYPLAAKENYGFSDATDGATVKIRRDQAYSNGLQWIVITDHAGENRGHWTDQARLELDEWKIYQLACSRATTLYSPTVTVCPGEELATKELGQLLGPTGHLLCYGTSSDAASYGSCQDLTSRATGDGGFGIIAHPYQGVPWSKDWSATPWNGLELISNRSAPDAQAVTKWDEQLRANLSDEVANKYRCVGMSNSDVHFTLNNSSWGGNMNYIYTGKPEVPGTDDVWKSIRNGALTASSDGSFAAATVNGVYPGYTATVAAGSTVSVVVTGTPVKPTYTTAKVTVLVNGQAVPLNVRGQTTDIIPLRNGRSFTTPYSIPISTDAYIRVEVRYCIGGTDKGYCFVNPVFISASGTSTYTLTTTASPSTGGMVAKNPDLVTYAYNTPVTLTATLTAGYTFTGWSGDLTGSTNPASITMTGNKNVTATFQASPVTYTLTTTVSPSTGGMVTKSPNQSSYPSGTVVTLTAAPAAGYALTGWSGDLTGSTNPTTIAMTGNKNVTAVFQANTPPSAPVLLSPSNGLTGVSRTPTFQWSASSGTAPITYTLQVSTNSIFNSMVVNQPGLSATSYTLTTSLFSSTLYYWRVQAINSYGSPTSSPYSFTTAAAVTVPDFSISVTPPSQTIAPGGSATYTVTVTALNGFNSSVALSATGLPSGAGASFTPSSLTPTGSSTVRVSTSTRTLTGSYIIAITATGGGITHSTNVTLRFGLMLVPPEPMITTTSPPLLAASMRWAHPSTHTLVQ